MAEITYREALNQALSEEILRDPNVVLMGEEVAQFKGSYKVSEGLLEKFGSDKIIDTPISEAAFSGLAVGAAMMGIRPVVEFMFWSFCYVAFDQIFNNAANVRYMSGGLINVPIVFRGPANGGTNVGATHSHTPENFAANTPGIKVICPATPADAKGMMKAAIRDNDPVCVMENTILYNLKGEVPEDDDFVIPLGKARVACAWVMIFPLLHTDALSKSLYKLLKLCVKKNGVSVEVLDLRSIRPLDLDAILQTVKKTNRVLLVEENKPFCGVDAQIAYLIQEHAFDYLDAPIKRVSAIDVPQAYSKVLENFQIPNHDRVLAKALERSCKFTMSTIIEMPKLSDTMTVGTVVKWYKEVGDQVENGDIYIRKLKRTKQLWSWKTSRMAYCLNYLLLKVTRLKSVNLWLWSEMPERRFLN